MKLSLEVITGVAAGLIIAALSWLFNKMVLPWMRSLFYHGPDINGEWLPYQSATDDSPFGTASITQQGTKVRMKLTRTRSRKGKAIHRTFRYNGSFHEGQLTLLFEEEGAKGFITGAIVLRLSSNVKQLAGKTTYFDHGENIVVSYDLILKRAT